MCRSATANLGTAQTSRKKKSKNTWRTAPTSYGRAPSIFCPPQLNCYSNKIDGVKNGSWLNNIREKVVQIERGTIGVVKHPGASWDMTRQLCWWWEDGLGGPLLAQQRRDSPSQRVELTPVVRISALAKSWSWPGAAFNPSSERRTVQQSTAKSLVEPGHPLKSCLESNHHQHHNHCQSISSHYHHKCKHPSLVRLASKSLELSSAPKA